MTKQRITPALALIACSLASFIPAQTRLVPIAPAWAKNTINANILRYDSIVSDDTHQYVGFYDPEGYMNLARRTLGSTEWEIKRTPYTGNIKDAHNTINLMLDGDGFLHVSWDHHNDPLRYSRSIAPSSLELTGKLPMVGEREDRVTYPEFHRLPDGDLIFLYRAGRSGRGDLVMNRYHRKTQTWERLQDTLISGEGERSAYWQMCVDPFGTLHLSWVWRESSDVATNHDMGYARSRDGGRTWEKTTGERYVLPITQATAEYAALIPQNHELINTNGIAADRTGRPYMAAYWRPVGTDVPQYHLIHHDGSKWHVSPITRRTTGFRLGGGGTKRIPISRARILIDSRGSTDRAYVVFRDAERGSRITLATADNLKNPDWQFVNLTDFPVGMWEPSLDTLRWERAHELHLYVQNVGQGDGETLEDFPPTQASVLEWRPN